MPVSRKVRIVLILFLLGVAAGGLVVWIALPHMNQWIVGFHQKGVTRSLAAWAIEDANITNEASAIHAAEMIGYMKSYYVPGEGYRSSAEVEAALERQRRESIERVAASLEAYTGLKYGTNVERWLDWAANKKAPSQVVEPNAVPVE